jgi:type IV secretory pathway TrbD component
MLREHVINFLEAAVVLLMLTNAFSVGAAAYAIALALSRTDRGAATQPRLLTVLARRLRVNG